MKRRILIDALGINLVGGGRTGIHTLLDTMFRFDQRTPFVVLLSEYEPLWSDYPNVHQRVIRTRGRFAARAYLQCRLPIWAYRERASLVHFTKNLAVFGLPCPYVVTVHDLTTLLRREQHTFLDVAYWRWVQPLTVRKAARVVAVSHDTARDIRRFYGISQESIEVIHWAPHARFVRVQDARLLNDMRRRYRLPLRYILFVGILAKKKNLPTLLQGLAQLRARMPDAPDLVVVGRQYRQSADTVSVTLVRELGLAEHVHFVGPVPDDDLPLLYAASELYVLPSLHEGFGIPALEAMACGVPVVVTGSGALPEVVGDAALLVDDPFDAAGLGSAMECLLGDEVLREKMIQRGFRRAAAFSWEKSAHRMLDIYYSLVENGKR